MGPKRWGAGFFRGRARDSPGPKKTLSERGEMRDCRFGLRFLIASSHFFDPNGKNLYLNWKARDCRQNLLRIRFSLMRTETPRTLEGWAPRAPLIGRTEKSLNYCLDCLSNPKVRNIRAKRPGRPRCLGVEHWTKAHILASAPHSLEQMI